MQAYVEHANITVRDLDEAVRFLTTAIPHWRVRGRGLSSPGPNQRPWLHLGDDNTYIALEQATEPEAEGRRRYRGVGINHIGIVVDDAAAVHQRLQAAGYSEGFQADPHPQRTRLYYTDSDGNEWEFVEYFSDDPSERNDYSQ